MIALLYYPIYLLIVTIVTLNLRKVYANRNGLSSYSEAPGTTNSILYFAILLGIVIGIRPVQPVFGDMVNTVQSYNMLYQNTPFVFDFEAENFLYDNILALFGALDLGTEAKLQKALRENLKDTTVIMIAQRIASVMHADRIAVIENGTITACDTHDKLMEISTTYRDIYASQMRNGGDIDG